MKNKTITRNAYVRSSSVEMADNESRQIEFVISSEAVDTYDTVFKMEGWDLTRYAKNPIVCYQHRSNTDNPDDIIGTSEVFVDGDQLIGRVTFEPGDINPKAEKVFQKVCNGTLKMASVGAQIIDGRMGDEKRGEDKNILYFTQQRLMEWSIVSAGANPDALKRNEESINEIRTEVAKEIEINQPIEVNKRSVVEAQILINKNKQNV